MEFGPESIEPRIKRAGDKYVEGKIDEEELERRIDRAFDLEFSYNELLRSLDLYRPVDSNEVTMIFGKEIEPGESISFADTFDVDPLEYDVCPY